MAGETYYRKNRVKANIAPSDVAKELGLSYRRYTLIEKGIIKMPNDLINKFNEVINRGLNINKLDQLNNEQIVNEYKRFISLGIIKFDEKLPSCRQLASDLGINPNTVQRAYNVLEQDGYINVLPKKGVYVCYQVNNDVNK